MDNCCDEVIACGGVAMVTLERKKEKDVSNPRAEQTFPRPPSPGIVPTQLHSAAISVGGW